MAISILSNGKLRFFLEQDWLKKERKIHLAYWFLTPFLQLSICFLFIDNSKIKKIYANNLGPNYHPNYISF